jgi:hypothetical protein
MHLNKLQMWGFQPLISTLKIQGFNYYTYFSISDNFCHCIIMNIFFYSIYYLITIDYPRLFWAISKPFKNLHKLFLVKQLYVI